ncbi:MAG: hypothetical protein B0D94_03220, partial [Candidatus Sedimenticola endophacoides]
MWRWLILVLLSPVAWGMGDYAATIHNSEWTHSGSNTLCTLAHEITGYGVGRFELRPGRRLAFVVETLQPGKGEGEAQVTIRPPPWIHDAEAWAPVAVKLGRGKRLLVIEGALGEQLLDALKRGWSAQIEHAGRSGAPVRASLNPVNFQKGYRDYRACGDKLLPYSFEEVRRNTLRFETRVSLPRERFWDIPVPKIDSPTRQPLLPRPSCAHHDSVP